MVLPLASNCVLTSVPSSTAASAVNAGGKFLQRQMLIADAHALRAEVGVAVEGDAVEGKQHRLVRLVPDRQRDAVDIAVKVDWSPLLSLSMPSVPPFGRSARRFPHSDNRAAADGSPRRSRRCSRCACLLQSPTCLCSAQTAFQRRGILQLAVH